MEPGHEDREYQGVHESLRIRVKPQWSPVMKTGNTGVVLGTHRERSPASMEPGHEDREYGVNAIALPVMPGVPQWSPVMKTGNTARRPGVRAVGELASMEPGHEDREYEETGRWIAWRREASMEPGHEDREYWVTYPRRVGDG